MVGTVVFCLLGHDSDGTGGTKDHMLGPIYKEVQHKMWQKCGRVQTVAKPLGDGNIKNLLKLKNNTSLLWDLVCSTKPSIF